MFDRNTIYFEKIRGDTLNSFCLHFWMMIVLPLATFFILRSYLSSNEYDDTDSTMYAAFGAVVAVQLVIINYVIMVLRDPDSFAPEEKPKEPVAAFKPAIPKIQRNEISQATIEKMREADEKTRQKEMNIDDPKVESKSEKKEKKKGNKDQKESEIETKKSANETDKVEKRTTTEPKSPNKTQESPEIKKEAKTEENKAKKKNKNKEKKE